MGGGEAMREALETKVGVRKIFTGIFKQYGFVKNKDGSITTTMLLSEIKSKGVFVSDHVWVERTELMLLEIGYLSPGVKLMFSARVKPYYKSGHEKDIGLYDLTKVKRCRWSEP
jgi:hypothetical protein